MKGVEMIPNYALTGALATQRQEEVRAAAARHSRRHGADEIPAVAPVRARLGWLRVMTSRVQTRLS